MYLRIATSCLAATILAAVPVDLAGAQPLGQFRWQLQNFCNVVTLSVVQAGTIYTLDGTDDMCGAAEKASVNGVAFINPSGSVGFGLTIVPPGAQAIQVAATISVAGLSGTWQDSLGNGGAFVFNGAAPALPPRPPASAMRLATSHTAWSPFNSADNLTFGFFSNRATITKATAGTNFVSLSPTIPVVLDGRRLQLLGVEFCYLAAATAVLDHIELNTTTHVTDVTNITSRVVDDTDRSDEACRLYALTTPYVLAPHDAVNLFVRINFTTAGATFRIGRATFLLEPTTTPAGTTDPGVLLTDPSVIIGGEAPAASSEPRRPGPQ